MNKLLISPMMAVLLASCGAGAPTPPSTVGVWEGNLTGPGITAPVLTFTFEQSNTPNPGDFSGTITQPNDPEGLRFTGNSLQGTLNSSDSSGGIACQGTFTTVRYEATCVLTSGSNTAKTNLVLNKR